MRGLSLPPAPSGARATVSNISSAVLISRCAPLSLPPTQPASGPETRDQGPGQRLGHARPCSLDPSQDAEAQVCPVPDSLGLRLL